MSFKFKVLMCIKLRGVFLTKKTLTAVCMQSFMKQITVNNTSCQAIN